MLHPPDVVCSVCGSQISPQVDGNKHYRRALKSPPQSRRCSGCKNYHRLKDGDWIVNPTTRYEDDPAARLFVLMFPEGAHGDIVGEALGISHQRVSQIEKTAFRRLLGNPQILKELRESLQYAAERDARRRKGDYD